ncbi:conserved hypothetical protein [Candidatus Desulfosporosinus infrequens]|uniref:Uncharacterized protein n=1 Tax=Candidatus Desulfosporosinus infrequens TaxID=2043169 RepID=A0A2U3K6S6_9FIRM|nr:conserved hypothetical protein [Candidatus Desulfosporosinus infrequens]
MFELIHGTPRSELYLKVFLRKLDIISKTDELPQGTELMAAVFLGVKVFTSARCREKQKTTQLAKDRFNKLEIIKSLMTLLTPRQFMNIFPITKEYDGDKYQSKDYFFTREMINTLDMDAAIGDKIDDFLWDYRNRDIERFQLEVFRVLSDLARAKGLPTPLEKFSAENGIPLYYEDKKHKEITGPIHIENVGGEYFYNDFEATTVPFKKPSPDYLKLV